MKIVACTVILLVMAAAGCASQHYSESSYQDKQVLQDYIRNHPDYYQEWSNELP